MGGGKEEEKKEEKEVAAKKGRTPGAGLMASRDNRYREVIVETNIQNPPEKYSTMT